MLFHVIPEDIFQHPSMRRRPFYIRAYPSSQHEDTRTHGMWNETVLPVLMATGCRNAGESECYRKGQTTKCGQKQCMKKQDCCRKVEESTKQTPQSRGEKKVATFDFRGFAPDQIKVKVTDKAVIIRGESKDSHSSVLVTKSLPLPQGADKTRVQCRYVDGHVIIQIPRSLSKMSHPQEKTERKEEPADVSSEKKDGTTEDEQSVTCSRDQDDVTNCDRELHAEYEKNLKKLAGIFTTIFGLQFDGEEDEEEKKSANGDTATGDKDVNGPKTSADTHTDACDGKTVPEDLTQCNHGDSDQTCPLLKYDEKLPQKDGDDDFVKVDKEEGDDSVYSQKTVDTELEADEADSVTTEARADDTEMSFQEPHSHTNNTTEEQTKEKGFKIQLDLSKYHPENVRVIFRDGDVIVEAEREIEADNHTEVEKLSRRIRLPEKVDKTKLKSVLNAGGVLSVQAPFKSEKEQEWKIINVVHEDC